MKKAILSISLILSVYCNLAIGQINIDDSAIDLFWKIADTLANDKNPSEKLWTKYSEHPAHQQIQRSGNRVTFLKRVLPIVFMPSNSESLNKLVNGKESIYQYFAIHLIKVKSSRKELEQYLEATDFSYIRNAVFKSAKYLPDDVDVENLKFTVHLALFEDNGFGGNTITIDLLNLCRGSEIENTDFFAHEFHHSLRTRTSQLKEDPRDDPILSALHKLPLEGVASLIDKSKYFDPSYYLDSANIDGSKYQSILEFRNLVSDAPSYLKSIDSILVAALSLKEKEIEIFKNLPWSGHAIGFYIARAIEEQEGLNALIKVQYSPADFLLTYQKAAVKTDDLYQFSVGAIEAVKNLK